MSELTRNAPIVFDMLIRSAPSDDDNYANQNTIALNNVAKFGTVSRAVLRFRKPSRLRAGAAISAANLTINTTVGLGISPPDIRIAPMKHRRMTIDATWNNADGTNAWDLVGGDYDLGVAHQEAGPSTSGDKTYDIASVVEAAVMMSPNSEYIDLIIRAASEIGSFSWTFNALHEASGADGDEPSLEITFDDDPPSAGEGGSVSLAPNALGLRV